LPRGVRPAAIDRAGRPTRSLTGSAPPCRLGIVCTAGRRGGAPSYPRGGGLNVRTVLAGSFASFAAGRRGRTSNSPPQLGQIPANGPSVQAAQKVHS
jgi:hypothetical protein